MTLTSATNAGLVCGTSRRMKISNCAEARVWLPCWKAGFLSPEQYPLVGNAVVTACNQKPTCEPVMSLSERPGLLDTL